MTLFGGASDPLRSTAKRRDDAAPWRHVDLFIVAPVVVLSVLGTVMIYSATRTPIEQSGGDPTTFLDRQLLFVAVGLVTMAVVATVDYRRLSDGAWLVFGLAVVALVAVISPLGTESKGAQAWFQLGSFQLQPSEFAKPAVIVALAALAARSGGEVSLRRVAQVLAVTALPVGLIYLQPDVGTILVFFAVLGGLLVAAGVKGRHLTVLGLIAVLGVFGMFRLDVLEDYQQARLTAFIDPADDLQRAGYNQNQSQIAIGAGGFAGAGLFEGSQTNLSYVPEQHTDFIFTAVGEELGFLGAASVLALFALLVARVWRAARLSADLLGTLLCVGIMSMLVFQVFQNVGMATGIMPITGIPLPFLSYGGSGTITAFITVGLALNVGMRRFV
ncbi:MAG TPA: rod shape-determining protein RodA [Acidimicrobiales bacterium]